MPPQIAKVVVGLPVEGPFDYLIPKPLAGQVCVGSRVRISFGPRKKIGYVVGLAAKSRFRKLKSLSAVIDTVPILSASALKIAEEFSEYYGCSLGEAVETILPDPLRKGRPVDLPPGTEEKAPIPSAPPEHIWIRSGAWGPILEQIKKALACRKGVIVLVPETHWVDGARARISQELGVEALAWDRRLSAPKELEVWASLKTGQSQIVIGTRSAVFAPVYPGLIVVFEEENSAYRQEQSPSYHAREVAYMRSKLERCGLAFVSAAPSAELWHFIQNKKMAHDNFAPAKDAAEVMIVDMANYKPGRGFLLSVPLRNTIETVLKERGKVLLFMNRKGFSTMTQCSQCHYAIRCERCDVNMTYLYSKRKMTCRLCGQTGELPKVCPQCKSSYLKSTGMGIEKLESEVARIFPQARVDHYDRDSKKLPQSFDILIATQAVLREQDQVSVAVVGIIQIDPELNRTDFRAAQRTFSLLTHLKRIAVRKLIIQTRIPDNYCLKSFQKGDTAGFYRQELKFRKEMELPPYRHLAAVGLRGAKEEEVFAEATRLFAALEKNLPAGLELADLHPDIIPKLRDKYRFTIILKGKTVKKMLVFLKKTLDGMKRKRSIIVTVHVDP